MGKFGGFGTDLYATFDGDKTIQGPQSQANTGLQFFLIPHDATSITFQIEDEGSGPDSFGFWVGAVDLHVATCLGSGATAQCITHTCGDGVRREALLHGPNRARTGPTPFRPHAATALDAGIPSCVIWLTTFTAINTSLFCASGVLDRSASPMMRPVGETDIAVAVHPVLGAGLLMSTRFLPPLPMAHLRDPPDRRIPLREDLLRRLRWRCGLSRGDHDRRSGPPNRRERNVDRPRVVRPVRREPLYGYVDPLDEGDANGRVINAAAGQLGGGDEALGVHRELQLAPGSPLVRRPMLVRMPGLATKDAIAHDPQPCGIDGDVERPVVPPDKPGDLHRTATTRERGVVRRIEIQAHQADQRPDKALRLTEREVKHGAQRQLGDDRQIGVPVLAARASARWSIPRVDGIRIDPQHDVSTVPEGRLLPPGLSDVGSWLTADRTQCYQRMQTGDATLFDAWIERRDDRVEFEVIPLAGSTSERTPRADAGSQID